MADAIFVPDGERFVPTDLAGSPWGDTLVHGGPPAGLMARAIERFAGGPEMQVVRLTIDLFRPVPKAPLEVTARTVRAGKRIHVVESMLLADGAPVCRASGLLLRQSDTPAAAAGGPAAMPAGPDGIESMPLASTPLSKEIRAGLPRRKGFHTTVEARWLSRSSDRGAVIAWLHMPVPLVAGEETTPLVRLAALCDFVNALSSIGAGAISGYINVDCTLYVQRPPAGEWICLEVTRTVGDHGLGVSTARLYDIHGAVGSATQAVLANTMR